MVKQLLIELVVKEERNLTGAIAQWLRAFAAFTEDWGLILNTWRLKTVSNAALGDPMSVLASLDIRKHI